MAFPKEFAKILAVFLIVFTIFSILLYLAPGPIGNDGNYHIKIAEQMRDNGILNSFKWLRFTILNENFVDLHFFYHVLLIPFTFFGLENAVKISTAFFTALLFSIFYYCLKKNRQSYPEFWVFALLSSSSFFIFRMFLGRAIVLGLIFLILQFFFIERKNYLALFLLSFAFTWSYIGFPMAIIIAILYIFSDFFISKTFDAKILSSAVAGTIFGLIINPYFPKNLSLLYTTLIQIPLLREFGNSEWSSINSMTFFSDLFGIFVLGLVLLFLLVEKKLSMSKRSKIFMIIAICFFIASLDIVRAGDYFVPISILFFASAATDYFRKSRLKFFSIKKLNLFLLLCFLFTSIALVAIESRQLVSNSTETVDFKPCAQWLNDNTPRDSTVFLWYYHYFPTLYFFDTHNTYTYGLDEHFGYAFDKNLFNEYRDIISSKKNLERIQKDFDSNYVFIYRKDVKEEEINVLKNSRQLETAIDASKCVVFKFK